MIHLKTVSSLVGLLLFALFVAPFAFAQTAVELEASAAIEASIMPPPLPTRPLDLIKARAQQIKQNAQGQKMELRADTKMQLRSASSGPEKRDIVKDAWGERKDIAKERFASTTQLARGVKNLVLMHGGVIKNRFRLAINHLNNLLTRIDTRLDKMTANGIDTSSVATLKVEAELSVDKAEADAKAIADFMATVNESSDRAAVKSELAAKIRTAHDSVKAAHAAVMKVVRALVKLAVDTKAELKVDASVSATTSVQ